MMAWLCAGGEDIPVELFQASTALLTMQVRGVRGCEVQAQRRGGGRTVAHGP